MSKETGPCNPFLFEGQFDPTSKAHFKLSFGETFDGDEYDTIDDLKEFKKGLENEAERDVP